MVCIHLFYYCYFTVKAQKTEVNAKKWIVWLYFNCVIHGSQYLLEAPCQCIEHICMQVYVL